MFYHIFCSDGLFILRIVCQLNGTIFVRKKKKKKLIKQANKLFVVAIRHSKGVSVFYIFVLTIAIDRFKNDQASAVICS